MAKPKTSMTVKTLKSFLNPMTNKIVGADHFINVPPNRFWLKRIQLGDCQKVKSKPKAASEKSSQKSVSKDSKKGSK